MRAEMAVEIVQKIESRLFRPWVLWFSGIGIVSSYLAVLLHSFGHGWITDGAGRIIQRDFVWMWSGSFDVLHGRGSKVFDASDFALIQSHVLRVVPGHQPLYRWIYPPTDLLLIAPLAAMPYTVAFLTWIGVTLAFYLWSIWLIVRRGLSLLLALIPLAVPLNIVLGHNGLLNAALVGIAVATLESRPMLAGFSLGLLSYKPQLDLLFPVVAVATKRWRAIVVAVVFTSIFAGAAALAFGVSSWAQFFAQLAHQSTSVNFMPVAGLSGAVQHSIYGLLTWFGAAPRVALIAHGIAALLSWWAAIIFWKKPVPYPVRAAALVLAGLAATPYLLMYDLALLSIPAALLIRQAISDGFLWGERLLIASCFVLQFLAARIPVGPLISAVLAVLIVRRAFHYAPDGRRKAAPGDVPEVLFAR